MKKNMNNYKYTYDDLMNLAKTKNQKRVLEDLIEALDDGCTYPRDADYKLIRELHENPTFYKLLEDSEFSEMITENDFYVCEAFEVGLKLFTCMYKYDSTKVFDYFKTFTKYYNIKIDERFYNEMLNKTAQVLEDNEFGEDTENLDNILMNEYNHSLKEGYKILQWW